MKKLTSFIKKNWAVLCVILIGLIPVIWFVKYGGNGVLINGVDTNFPLNPITWFKRRFFVWNAIPNGGINFASSTAGTFFHLIQAIPYFLGFRLEIVQLLSFVFWFSLIAFSSFTLSRILFPKRPLVQLLFVVFYSLNIYLFNSWENVKVANLSLISALPLGISTVLLLTNDKISKARASLYALVTGIVLAGSGINPSYFAVFFIILSMLFAVQLIEAIPSKKVFTVLASYSLFFALVVLVNLYWILPTLHFILFDIGPEGSITVLGFTDWVDSLSKNTSLLNVIRMQGAWDWYAFDSSSGLPLYIPYAVNFFFKFPFIVFSFLVPILVLVSFVFRSNDQKYLYPFFALLIVIGVFLGAGTHEPTGYLFKWLALHIPFFSLFRSPWYIFTPMVVLAYSGMLGLLFERTYSFVEQRKLNLGKTIVNVSISVLIIGNLFYSYPLITGKIFRPYRSDGFNIQFPDYVLDAQKNIPQVDGRVIGYPDDEIEQFEWRYRGIESILSIASDEEVLFAPLNSVGTPTARIISQFYSNLKKGQNSLAFNVIGKVSASRLFYKNDQKSLSPDIRNNLINLSKDSVGKWDFYDLPKDVYTPRIFSPTNMYFSYPYSESPISMGMLDTKDILVNPNDSVIGSIHNLQSAPGHIVVSENSQLKRMLSDMNSSDNYHFTDIDLSYIEFVFSIPKDGSYIPNLERYKLEDFGIKVFDPLTVSVDGRQERWDVNNISDYVEYVPRSFTKGDHRVVIELKNSNLITGGSLDSENLFEVSGEGGFEIKEDNNNKYLNIANRSEKDISAIFKLNNFDPFSKYFVHVKYWQVYGDIPGIFITQGKDRTLFKSQYEGFAGFPQWQSYNFYFDPVKTDSYVSFSLVAPSTDKPLGTISAFDDLEVRKVFTNNLLFINKQDEQFTTPKIESEKVSPVKYKIHVSNAKDSHFVVFSENYSPEWKMKIVGDNEVKLNDKHFTANYFANGWYVETPPEEYEAVIYYDSQKYYTIGIVFFLLTLTVPTALFFLKRKKI